MTREVEATTSQAATLELWSVAETDRIDQIDTLLESGADINAANAHGVTALMRAAANGSERMVSALLNLGADPNATRNDGFTALLLASFFGHEGTVRILVEHGADVNAASRFETSAKMWATCRNFYDVVDYLEHPLPEPEVVDSAPETTETISVGSVVPGTSTFERLKHQESVDLEGRIQLLAARCEKVLPSRISWTGMAAAGGLVIVFVAALGLTDLAIRRDDRRPAQPLTTVASPSNTLLVNESSWSRQTQADALPAPKPAIETPAETSSESPSETKHQTNADIKPVEQKSTASKSQRESTTPSTESTFSETPSSGDSRVTQAPRPEETKKVEVPAEASRPRQQATATSGVEPPKQPAARTTQLIGGAKTTPPGKVIRWP